MKALVTGSAGHLGEGLMRTLLQSNVDAVGVDLNASPFTTHQGSIANRSFVAQALAGVDTVYHTATLHKPHIATHSLQEFIDINISGTLILLEESVRAGVQRFVFTSTTSVFGDALVPKKGQPAAWITEELRPVPKNIYGVTKHSAENLCELFYRNYKLPCIVLRTSRFFLEEDDDLRAQKSFVNLNLKANEFLYRRVDIEDAVNAHILAATRADSIGFATYIISATTPFSTDQLAALRNDVPSVVKVLFPEYEELFDRLGWRMLSSIDRVYINEKARRELDWNPTYNFNSVLKNLASGNDFFSPLAGQIGSKGYHDKFRQKNQSL